MARRQRVGFPTRTERRTPCRRACTSTRKSAPGACNARWPVRTRTTRSMRRPGRASRCSTSTTPAARSPTPAPSATRPGACTRARSRRSRSTGSPAPRSSTSPRPERGATIMSWAGKILRVNLTTGTVKSEPLNMTWARAYIGSRGLASKYLVEEIDPKVDPLSADNKIIWATGPLTGTMASTGGRYTVVTKGPLTGAIACSNSGGYFGAELKFAGWDMVIFEGRSAKPVYLSIADDVVELRDASHLWGKSVWQTEETLKKQHQDPLLRVSSIGLAGENRVLFAAVINDLHRAAGRSGVGAVMGSKNLKALAVRGTKGVGNIADPKAFMQVVAEKKKILADNAVTGQGLPTYGTQVLMNVINEVGAIPTRNARDVQFEGARKISGEAMHEKRPGDGKANLVTNAACFGCTIACGRISKIDQPHFSVRNKPEYWGASGGLEYEAAWALGAANGVNDLEALQYANLICNEQGMDPISFGATIGALMELYEMGIVTKDMLGLEAPFGSAKALCELADMTAKGVGFGKEIAQGSKRLTE